MRQGRQMTAKLVPRLLFLAWISTLGCHSRRPESPGEQQHNLTSAWIGESSGPFPSKVAQYAQAPSEYIRDFVGMLSRSRSPNQIYGNPHFVDLESHQKKMAALASRPSQDQRPLHSYPDYDLVPLKKHDFMGGQFGGWDVFPGGPGFGQGGGFGQAGQVIKKGKEAKALFILMAPLILLAVFGPILATQAMIPWIAGGGLTSVTTVAGGRRRKRSTLDPSQVTELDKRLQLFLEVQEFIAKSGSVNLAEEMGEAFLRCQKYTERRNKCLERVACEYNDATSAMDHEERRIAKMVLRNVMSNPVVPATLKTRLVKGSSFGRKHRGLCKNYWCEVLDA